MTDVKTSNLKSFFSPALVRRLSSDLARVHPNFPERAFVKDACAGLRALELLARGNHIAAALVKHLPQDYTDAVDVLLRSLGPEHATNELMGVGMAPFYYLPHTIFVAKQGVEHFELSMHAQYELTKRFSAESCMRAYIARNPNRTFTFLHRWATDSNAHVRRLVSECTRLRLPWAARVPWLDAHLERVLALIELLKDDPSSMVRRSVANNLNDIGKVRPDLLTRTCAVWLKDATDARRALVEHALRSAVKRGEAGALQLLGYGNRVSVRLESVRFDPPRAAIGGRVAMSFVLRSRSNKSQNLLVDVAVHFVKANGDARPKVFKVKRVTLQAHRKITFQMRFSLAVHTTRVPHPGVHPVDILVNGRPLRAGGFEVLPP